MRMNSAPQFLLASLRYVLWMRIAVSSAQASALLAARFLLDLQAAFQAAWAVIAVVAAVTWRSFVALHRGEAPDESEFFRQLVFDVCALSAFLFCTGGATNPFAPLFLLPVVVAVATLRPRHAWRIVAIAALLYTVLMFVHVPLHLHGDAGSSFELHVWGMWVGFLLAAGLVAYFVSQIGMALRARDAELARGREQELHTGRMLALGTLAAGTAHELGTPLSTMAVVVSELQAARADDASLTAELQLVRDQVTRCRDILRRMSSSAGLAQADRGGPMNAAAYMQGVVQGWRDANPRLELALQLPAGGPAPQLVVDYTLTQAIVNVFDNAARVSKSPPHAGVAWDGNELLITVRDFGPGIPSELAADLGRAVLADPGPDTGLGLGVFLARTTIERLGGSMRFLPGEGGGCVTEIRLPLAPLTVTP